MVKNHMVLLSCPVKSNSSPVQVQSKSSLSPVQQLQYICLYGSPLCSNICLSHRITYINDKLPLELHLRSCVENLNADPLH